MPASGSTWWCMRSWQRLSLQTPAGPVSRVEQKDVCLCSTLTTLPKSVFKSEETHDSVTLPNVGLSTADPRTTPFSEVLRPQGTYPKVGQRESTAHSIHRTLKDAEEEEHRKAQRGAAPGPGTWYSSPAAARPRPHCRSLPETPGKELSYLTF